MQLGCECEANLYLPPHALSVARFFAAVGREYLQAVFDLISFGDFLTGERECGEWNAEHLVSALRQFARFWATRN